MSTTQAHSDRCIVCGQPTSNTQSTNRPNLSAEAIACAEHDDESVRDAIKSRLTMPTVDELIEDIESVAKTIGRTPTYREYVELADYSYAHIYQIFGSWSNAIEESDLEPREHNRNYNTNDEILDDVRRVAAKLGRPPNCSEYARDPDSIVTRRTVYRRWDSWSDVVDEL